MTFTMLQMVQSTEPNQCHIMIVFCRENLNCDAISVNSESYLDHNIHQNSRNIMFLLPYHSALSMHENPIKQILKIHLSLAVVYTGVERAKYSEARLLAYRLSATSLAQSRYSPLKYVCAWV